jgi:hypothetical protein
VTKAETGGKNLVQVSGQENAVFNEAEIRFSKEQFLQSGLFSMQERDLLMALLDNEQVYTKAEVDYAVRHYLKRSVI